MNLAGYVKCLKRHALNKKISDEEFFNAVLKLYIEAGEIDNKNADEIYFDKSRTSLILNRHEDVPGALRKALNSANIYTWTEENFEDEAAHGRRWCGPHRNHPCTPSFRIILIRLNLS